MQPCQAARPARQPARSSSQMLESSCRARPSPATGAASSSTGRIVLRHVVSGQRVPMELTSLGRAYLAAAPSARRKALLDSFRLKRGAQWPALEQQIQAAIKSVKSQGFCAASWQPEVVALATPLVTPDAIYVLNCSVSTTEPLPAIVQELHPALLQLGRQIESLLEKL